MKVNISMNNRLDIFVKTLYIRAYLSWVNLKYYKKLYRNHIRLYNLSKEDDKNSIDDFLDNFNNLINNFKDSWFDEKYPIPVNQDWNLMNWAHRLACSLYFWIEPIIEVKIYDYDINWWLEWFKKNNFSDLDILNILEEYNIYEKLDLMIVWPWYKNSIKVISSELINNWVQYIWDIWIDFDKKSFIEFVNDIYSYDIETIKSSIYEKSLDLIKIDTKIKIIVTQNNWINKKLLKEELRKKILKDNDSIYNTFHWWDNEKEENYIKSIILNANNITHLKMRKNLINNNFLKKISVLEKFLKNNGIKKDDICIVWSWSLWVFWINKVTDIDIIQKKTQNKWVIKYWEIDILDYEYFKKKSNEELIKNNKYNFLFRGLKFINLNLLQEIKWTSWNRIKDIEQSIMIKNFISENSKNKLVLQDFLFEIFFIKNRIRVSIISFFISLTKKLNIYNKCSHLWRKYILKNLK